MLAVIFYPSIEEINPVTHLHSVCAMHALGNEVGALTQWLTRYV